MGEFGRLGDSEEENSQNCKVIELNLTIKGNKDREEKSSVRRGTSKQSPSDCKKSSSTVNTSSLSDN